MENQIWFHKYRIIQKLGRGGSSEVYLAEHIKLKALRVIKQISKNTNYHDQLLQEAHILKDLNHSCIPIIYDFEEDAHNSYIIEQYIQGQSLKILKQQKGYLPENLIIYFAIQICELLQYLYSLSKPILYLDLNPENIIIIEDKVKLIDFGASNYFNQLNDRKFSFGTKGFAAPELYTRTLPDERADIYGMGTLLYYMVTGRSFDLSSQRRFRKEKMNTYSADLYKIIRKCIRYYPTFRYSSLKELKNKLLEFHEKNKKLTTSKSISIAIAGTQNRVGTTHLAILITSYLSKKGWNSLYFERNNSCHIFNLLRRYTDIKSHNGISTIYGCNLLPNCEIELPNKNGYQFVIKDYGCIQDDNLQEYIKSDVKLLVAGSKEWELDKTEETLKLLNSYDGIKYVFNFMDGKKFREILRSMEGLPCYRIPYLPNPFITKFEDNLEEFMENILDKTCSK